MADHERLHGATRRFLGFASSRGFWLDIFAFALNLAAMTGLSHIFRDVVRRAAADDQNAHRILFGMAIAMFVLAPIGATLSQWSFHQRRLGRPDTDGADHMGGCLFNPIFYFCLTAVIFATVNAFIVQTVYGKREPDGNVFVGSVFLGLGLMIAHTILVYRFFSTPKNPPKSAFMRRPLAGRIGDAFLFLNMALFQQVWSLLGEANFPPPGSIGEFVGRLFILLFLALLLYFPPRMFYLAEDIGKRWTWATILLANAPIIAKFVFGWGF